MINWVYCVMRSTWDGEDLRLIFKEEEDAIRLSEILNTDNQTTDFYVEKWEVS